MFYSASYPLLAVLARSPPSGLIVSVEKFRGGRDRARKREREQVFLFNICVRIISRNLFAAARHYAIEAFQASSPSGVARV